jgi:hypothetical protein
MSQSEIPKAAIQISEGINIDQSFKKKYNGEE